MKVDVFKKAIEIYGADMQLNVAIEEFSELTKEICKYKRGSKNIPNIIEEIADCYIMLSQLQIIFNLDFTEIAEWVDKKVERLKGRLKDNTFTEIKHNSLCETETFEGRC